MLKKLLATTICLGSLPVAAAHAGTSISVNINPPAMVVAAPPAAVAVVPPQVAFRRAPRFIFAPTLGFYVAVETPYNLIYLDGRYFLRDGRFWYGAPYYNGPWVRVRGRELPPGLRRFRAEEIRHHRDTEYRAFREDREHYRGRWYTPDDRR